MSEAKPFGWIENWAFCDVEIHQSFPIEVTVWPSPEYKTGLVPLFAKPEPYGPQWTKEPPSAPGHYWVWQPSEDWPCHGEVMTAMVAVDTRLGGVRAWAAKMNYGEYLGPESSKYGFWNSALWLGPIPAPELPAKDQR